MYMGWDMGEVYLPQETFEGRQMGREASSLGVGFLLPGLTTRRVLGGECSRYGWSPPVESEIGCSGRLLAEAATGASGGMITPVWWPESSLPPVSSPPPPLSGPLLLSFHVIIFTSSSGSLRLGMRGSFPSHAKSNHFFRPSSGGSPLYLMSSNNPSFAAKQRMAVLAARGEG